MLDNNKKVNENENNDQEVVETEKPGFFKRMSTNKWVIGATVVATVVAISVVALANIYGDDEVVLD